MDYHIEVEGHYYSVPYTLVKKQIDIRYSKNTVECFHHGKRVASHVRNEQRGGHTTVKEHRPVKHQKYMEWTPEWFKRWATKIGPETLCLTETLLVQRAHPKQAYRSLPTTEDHWHEQIGASTLADAILDRLVHAVCRTQLKGESMRKKKAHLT